MDLALGGLIMVLSEQAKTSEEESVVFQLIVYPPALLLDQPGVCEPNIRILPKQGQGGGYQPVGN